MTAPWESGIKNKDLKMDIVWDPNENLIQSDAVMLRSLQQLRINPDWSSHFSHLQDAEWFLGKKTIQMGAFENLKYQQSSCLAEWHHFVDKTTRRPSPHFLLFFFIFFTSAITSLQSRLHH